MARYLIFAGLLSLASAIDPRIAAMGSEKSTSIAPPSLAQRSSGCPNINPLGGSTPGTVSSRSPPNSVFKVASIESSHPTLGLLQWATGWLPYHKRPGCRQIVHIEHDSSRHVLFWLLRAQHRVLLWEGSPIFSSGSLLGRSKLLSAGV